MIVYRIEGLNGVGPYRTLENCDNGLANRLLSHGTPGSKRYKPSPKQDNIPGFYSGYHYCGFKSIEQLKRWFHGARAGLRRCGFKMITYKVSDYEVLFGHQQIVFPVAFAVKIAESPVP